MPIQALKFIRHQAICRALLCKADLLATLAGIGLAMWALGAVFTGVSFNYGWLLFARIFTGAGALQVSSCARIKAGCIPEEHMMMQADGRQGMYGTVSLG